MLNRCIFFLRQRFRLYVVSNNQQRLIHNLHNRKWRNSTNTKTDNWQRSACSWISIQINRRGSNLMCAQQLATSPVASSIGKTSNVKRWCHEYFTYLAVVMWKQKEWRWRFGKKTSIQRRSYKEKRNKNTLKNNYRKVGVSGFSFCYRLQKQNFANRLINNEG